MSARQQFIDRLNSEEVSLGQLALLAVQILKGDNAAAQRATTRGLESLAVLSNDARSAGCEESLERLVTFIGSERGFAGNAQDYYSADNSDLSMVLERRSGIPITLAIVYIELGRTMGFDLRGIGFPGHFLVGHYADVHSAADGVVTEGEAGLIDPFAGKLTTRSSCLENLARDAKDHPQAQIDAWFAPATSPQIALRLLENLKQIYLHNRSLGQALAALDLQLLVAPESFELLQQQQTLSAQIFGRDNKPPLH